MDQTWWVLIKLIIALPIVIVSAVLVLRLGFRGFKKHGGSGTIRVVDCLFLNSRASLYIVDVQGSYYLLGHQDGRVIMLDKLDNYRPLQPAKGTVSFESMLGEKMIQVSRSVTQKLSRRKGSSENDQ